MIVVGGSAGAVDVVAALLPGLPEDLAVPVVVCLHVRAGSGALLTEHLAARCRVAVVDARDKARLGPGRVHVAPPGYHVLVEREGTLSLSIDPPVFYCRPSIDVLFSSAARACGAGLVALLLSGANEDGVEGLRAVRAAGGRAIVQDPATAAFPRMPALAVAAGVADEIVSVERLLAIVRATDIAARAALERGVTGSASTPGRPGSGP